MSEAETTTPEEPVEPLEGPEHEPEPETDEDEDEDTEGAEEPAEEPEGEPESSAVMEEIGKKLDSLNKTVATRISSILGEHANDFEVCDLCSYWNTPGWRMSGHLPEDLRAQIMQLVGMRAPSTLNPDPHSEPCRVCDGEGFVDSRSKVVGQDQLPCVECESMGWVPTDDARRRGRLQLANGPTATALGVTPADLAMSPAPQEEEPEVAALRARGYVVVPPIAASA